MTDLPAETVARLMGRKAKDPALGLRQKRSVRLPASVWAMLEREAAESGCSVSDVVMGLVEQGRPSAIARMRSA